MKNKSIYIVLGIVAFILLIALFFYKAPKTFDDKITLSYKEKRPYATYVAYNTLNSFFNTPKPKLLRNSILNWKDSIKEKGNLMFIVAKQFNPSNEEIEALFKFVEEGNYVLISSLSFNQETFNFFHFNTYTKKNYYYSENNKFDTFKLSLNKKNYLDAAEYKYIGRTTEEYFSFENSKEILFNNLGFGTDSSINFIKATAGSGAFYLHSNPFVFCNFFLLQQNNHKYYEQILSAVPQNIKTILWDDYYTYKDQDFAPKEKQSLLRVLFKQESFKWFFWCLISLFIIYTIVHIKRKQRFVHAVKPLENDTLYFVETIGRLYYDKGDHKNLFVKITEYFLEHIRSKFQINTSHLNKEFIEKLSLKSGYNAEKTTQIIKQINELTTKERITETELNNFYIQIQHFYKNT